MSIFAIIVQSSLASVQNVAWTVDVSGDQPQIRSMAYNFSQLAYYVSLDNLSHYWDQIWPWISADGRTYLFFTFQLAYQVHAGIVCLKPSFVSFKLPSPAMGRGSAIQSYRTSFRATKLHFF